MIGSSKKAIKLNKIKPNTGLNASTFSFQRESQPERIARSVQVKDLREVESFSVNKSRTDSSQKNGIQPRNFQAKAIENEKTKKLLKFQLKCEDQGCDDDSCTLMSYGGYSIKSIRKKNPEIHNHRKLNQTTAYEYAEDEVPEIMEDLLERNMAQDAPQVEESKRKFPYPKLSKVNWKISPFAPIFVNKHPQLQSVNMHRNIEHQENRQKREIEKYQLERQIELERQKEQEAVKKRKTFKTDTKLEAKGKKVMQQPEKQKVRTRLQQKEQALSGFEVSQRAEPGHQAKYCYPCRVKFQDYWAHIQLPEHKLQCRKGIGSNFCVEEMENIDRCKVEEMKSEEYQYLVELEKYLKEVVENVEAIMTKKNAEMKQIVKKVNQEVKEWAKQRKM